MFIDIRISVIRSILRIACAVLRYEKLFSKMKNRELELGDSTMTAQQNKLIEELTKNAKVRNTKTLTRKFEVREDGDKAVKMSPQAVQILATIFTLGKKIVTEQEIVTAVEASELKTKQPKSRIWQYYRKSLVEAKFLVEAK